MEDLLNLFKFEFGSLIIGWILFVFSFIFKDLLSSLAFGISFYLDPQFVEGDVVYIDGDEAIIQKIGISITVFKMVETSRWRYIKNEKIRYHKLEKQIEKREK